MTGEAGAATAVIVIVTEEAVAGTAIAIGASGPLSGRAGALIALAPALALAIDTAAAGLALANRAITAIPITTEIIVTTRRAAGTLTDATILSRAVWLAFSAWIGTRMKPASGVSLKSTELLSSWY